MTGRGSVGPVRGKVSRHVKKNRQKQVWSGRNLDLYLDSLSWLCIDFWLYSIMQRCLKDELFIVRNCKLVGLFSMLFFIWTKNLLIDACVSLLYFCGFVFTFNLCCFDLSPAVPPPPHPVHRFAGRTVTSGSLVLVTVATKEEGSAQLTVNCEKMVIGTMLVKDVLLALTQWRVLGPPSHQHTSHILPETRHTCSISSVLL